MATTKKGSNRFVVDLGELALPPEAARQLNTEIRRLVLSALASVDLKGDLNIAARLPKEIGVRTEGIYIDLAKNVNVVK